MEREYVTHTSASDFPYIPCPPDPMAGLAEHKARIEELELQIKNMGAILATIHNYLQDNKHIIDRVAEIKKSKQLNEQKEIQAFLGGMYLDL